MAIVRHFPWRFEDEKAKAGFEYDDADAQPRVLRVMASNVASGNMYIKVTRTSDNAVFDLVCEPGFDRERPLNNSAAQRITVDLTNPTNPKLIGVSVEVQYPA